MKRIVLFLDGTWNDDRGQCPSTNIVRMRELLARSLRCDPPTADPSKPAHGMTDQGIEHIVHYDAGVGTGARDRLEGGAFGRGLTRNIRQAYKFISFHYRPDDEIYVFGFSRGAYTARSLVGYIAAAGILRRECCDAEREALAWGYYRTNPHDRLPATYDALTPFIHDRATTRIKCMGVFDTVGALGIPLETFRLANEERYSFHDVELGTRCDVNLHAVAIDERRGPFEATLWFKPKFKHYDKIAIEQVWFPGVHADIGGGYIEHAGAGLDHPTGLDSVALDWMIKRVEAHTPLRFDAWRHLGADYPLQRRHESLKRTYLLLKRAVRRINDSRPELGFWEKYPTQKLHSDVLAEMVHVSALERVGREEPGGGKYLPEPLRAALDSIEAAYAAPEGTRYEGPPTPVVGWDGEPLKASEPGHVQQVRRLLAAARQAYA